MGYPFHLADVFVSSPTVRGEGNQLLVLVDEERALTDDDLLNITREMGFAESACVYGVDPATGFVRVRIFTPEYEVPFAGHPTLGLAYVIEKMGLASVKYKGPRPTENLLEVRLMGCFAPF